MEPQRFFGENESVLGRYHYGLSTLLHHLVDTGYDCVWTQGYSARDMLVDLYSIANAQGIQLPIHRIITGETNLRFLDSRSQGLYKEMQSQRKPIIVEDYIDTAAKIRDINRNVRELHIPAAFAVLATSPQAERLLRREGIDIFTAVGTDMELLRLLETRRSPDGMT